MCVFVCLFASSARVGLRSAFVVDEEKREEHEVGDREGDSCYHVDRLRHSYRMRRFLFPQLKYNDRKAGEGKKMTRKIYTRNIISPLHRFLLFQNSKKKKEKKNRELERRKRL